MSSFSFEGTNAERTVACRRDRWRWFGRHGRGGRIGHRRLVLGILVSAALVFGHVLQERRGGDKKQVPGNGAAEVEQSIIVAGWPPKDAVVEHRFNGAGGTTVADEVSAKFTLRDTSERHVVAQYLKFFPVL